MKRTAASRLVNGLRTRAHWRDAIRVLGVALAIGVMPTLAKAQTSAPWVPTKPIKLVVPYPPGGGSDIAARVMVSALGGRLGQPIVIENKPGANGAVGTEIVFNAAPDGYTLIMSGTDAYSRYPALYPNAKFVSAQFVPVAPTAIVNFVLMGRPGLPAKNLPELLALAKKQQLSFSSWGNGSAGHVAMAQFNLVAKTEMLHVPYQGAAPAAQAVVGGQVDLTLMPVLLAYSFKDRLIPFGIAASQRLELIKDIPTLIEQGTNVSAPSWVGVLAPPKTPPAVVATLAKAMIETMSDPAIDKKLNEAGLAPLHGTTQEFATLIAKDFDFWGKAIRDAGIKVDQ
jgi:tripartite-type tricarboxylate transporter receptor subunit TctC